MRLEGDCEVFFPTLAADEALIKVGISNAPLRRLAELNAGFPPGAAIGWVLSCQRRFGTPLDAYAAESACLEALRNAGRRPPDTVRRPTCLATIYARAKERTPEPKPPQNRK
jgi:hypothetical protein